MNESSSKEKNTNKTSFQKHLKQLICEEKKQAHINIEKMLDKEESITF